MTADLGSRPWRFFVFTALYTAQGLVAGFGTTALVNHFVAQGLTVGDVGRHLAIVGLPWLLQPVLWGPVVDRARPRAMGRHRFWLAVAAVGSQACLAALLLLGGDPSLGVVGAVLLGHSLFASLQDTTTDRLMMETVPEGEVGRLTASTRAGFVAGGAVGAALFGELLGKVGFVGTVSVLLAVTVPLLFAALLVRERAGDALFSVRLAPAEPGGGTAVTRPGFRPLLVALTRGRSLLLLAVAFGFSFAVAVPQVGIAARLVSEGGWEATALSRFQASCAFVAGTAGTAAVGFAVDRYGARRCACGLLAAGGVLLPVLAWGGREEWHDPAVLGFLGLLGPLIFAALLALILLECRASPLAATQFQISMATMNGGDVAGSAATGMVQGALSPSVVIAAVTAAFLLSAAVLGSMNATDPPR